MSIVAGTGAALIGDFVGALASIEEDAGADGAAAPAGYDAQIWPKNLARPSFS